MSYAQSLKVVDACCYEAFPNASAPVMVLDIYDSYLTHFSIFGMHGLPSHEASGHDAYDFFRQGFRCEDSIPSILQDHLDCSPRLIHVTFWRPNRHVSVVEVKLVLQAG